MYSLLDFFSYVKPVDAFVLGAKPVVLMTGKPMGIELDLLDCCGEVYVSLEEHTYLFVAKP